MTSTIRVLGAAAAALAMSLPAGSARAQDCNYLALHGDELCRRDGFTGNYWHVRVSGFPGNYGEWHPMGINWVKSLEPYIRDHGQWQIGNRCGISSEHKTILSKSYLKHDDVGVTYTASWTKGGKAAVAGLIKNLGIELETKFENGEQHSSHEAESEQTSESHWMTAPGCKFSYERLTVWGLKDATLKVPAMRAKYLEYKCANHFYSSWSTWRRHQCGFDGDERPVEISFHNYASHTYPVAGSAYCGSGAKVPANPFEIESFSAVVPSLSGTCLPQPPSYPGPGSGSGSDDHDEGTGSGSGDPDGDGLPDYPYP